MPLTYTGRDTMLTLLIGGSATPFNNANARIGVGDGTTPFNPNQTDLQGTNKYRKAMDSGYPTQSGNQATFRATFGTGEANFAWQEWGLFNAGTGGVMLNRVVQYLGTKTSAQTWVMTVTLTLNVS